jgi:hypothetical protein
MPIENRSNVEMTACSALGGRPTLVGVGIGGREMLVEPATLANLDEEVEVYRRATFKKGTRREDGCPRITYSNQHSRQRDCLVIWTHGSSYPLHRLLVYSHRAKHADLAIATMF